MDSVSVSIIVKNEESCLEQCLESVKGIGEIVIVDTGSTDKTIEIAKKYTDKVFTDYKWNDNFAEARNHALSKCTTKWAFTIDADEVISNPELIPAAIEKAEKDGFSTISAIIQARNVGTIHYQPRLYMPEKARWKGAIHNYINVSEDNKSDIKVVYGYSEAHKLDPDRAFRILTKEVKVPGKVRELYYLAREYWYRSKFEEAIVWYNKYLAVASWAPEMADANFMIAKCYKKLNQYSNARAFALKAIGINNDFKEAIEFLADLSGPKNSERWLYMAYIANSQDVLWINSVPERDSSYYDYILPKDDFKRYDDTYKRIGELAEGNVLDMGCGTGILSKYIKDYVGFDSSPEAIRLAKQHTFNVKVASIYEYGLLGYDTYVMSEVLEHVDDLKVIDRIPKGARTIISVPSFADKSHIRRYTEKIIRERYRDVIDIDLLERYNWKEGKWIKDAPNTNSHITLFKGIKK